MVRSTCQTFICFTVYVYILLQTKKNNKQQELATNELRKIHGFVVFFTILTFMLNPLEWQDICY